MTEQLSAATTVSYLKESIRLLLEAGTSSYSEYDIIRYLNEQGLSLSLNGADSTVLFKTHFLVYHALYQLQVECWEESQRLLDISALSIGFIDAPAAHAHADVPATSTVIQPTASPPVSYESHQKLRAYYLDWSNLETATPESVDELLNQFWSYYVSQDDQANALAILQLPPDATEIALKERYRRLAMEHHPDRGGDAETFQKINWAFGILRKSLSKH